MQIGNIVGNELLEDLEEDFGNLEEIKNREMPGSSQLVGILFLEARSVIPHLGMRLDEKQMPVR